MGKDYGEPIRYDPDFRGPVHKRSCTDVLWLIIFIAFLGGWAFVGYYSVQHGNIEKLLAPIDSNGRRCGMDSGLENKKYLLFFDISKCLSPDTPIMGCPTKQVCVEKCPERTILFAQEAEYVDFNSLKYSMVCTENINVAELDKNKALQYISSGECASYVLESKPVLGRCFADIQEVMKILNGTEDWNENLVIEQLNRLLSVNELSSQIVQDLVQSRWYLVGALGGVIVVCFVYILLLRWVVAPVVWASIAGLFAVLAFSLYLCYKNYVYYKAHPVFLLNTNNLKGYTESIFTKHQVWLAILIVLAIKTLILLLMVIFLRGRIVIAIGLIKEASKAVTSIKSTMFFPLFPWIIQCGVFAFAILVLMQLLSIGDPTYSIVNLQEDTDCNCQGHYTTNYQSCTPQNFTNFCHSISASQQPCKKAICHFTGVESPNSNYYFQFVNLLGFFWTMFFISGVADMILASTFSTWYWTFHKRDVPFFTLTSGFARTISYHLGTVALGALIIAIVRVIRVILEYIDHQLKKYDNAFTKCIMCCCKCMFLCLENFLKFINKNAYIMCAVHGTNFCKSAREAFSLLMRNIVRVVVLDKVTDFVFFVSKVLISVGIGFAVYYLLEWNYVYEVTQGARLHYNYVPAIILSIATFIICSIFFNVYAMAVDTLFLCFLEDCERNDGSPDKPYFMSKNLMRILGKKNKF